MIDINSFASRHIGPRNEDINDMLEVVKCKNLDELIQTFPFQRIRFSKYCFAVETLKN